MEKPNIKEYTFETVLTRKCLVINEQFQQFGDSKQKHVCIQNKNGDLILKGMFLPRLCFSAFGNLLVSYVVFDVDPRSVFQHSFSFQAFVYRSLAR